MDATTHPAAEQLTSAAQDQGMRRVSVLEQTFGAFYDRTVDAAREDCSGKFKANHLMGDLNQIRTTLAGLGVVMRIITGNAALRDNFEPTDPESDVPLSIGAESSLAAMAGCICDLLVEQIDNAAKSHNDKADA